MPILKAIQDAIKSGKDPLMIFLPYSIKKRLAIKINKNPLGFHIYI